MVDGSVTFAILIAMQPSDILSDGAAPRDRHDQKERIQTGVVKALNHAIDLEKISSDGLLASIDAVNPVIELHHLVLRSDPPRGHELIANNGILAGVVKGQGVSKLETPLSTDLALIFDGETVDSWSSLRWPEDILSAIGWLAGKRAEAGMRLEKGDVILTGAFGPPIPLKGKTRVDVTSSAFGNVSTTFR